MFPARAIPADERDRPTAHVSSAKVTIQGWALVGSCEAWATSGL